MGLFSTLATYNWICREELPDSNFVEWSCSLLLNCYFSITEEPLASFPHCILRRNTWLCMWHVALWLVITWHWCFVCLDLRCLRSSSSPLTTFTSLHPSLAVTLFSIWLKEEKRTNNGIWAASSSEYRSWSTFLLTPLILLPWIPALLNVFFHPR